MVTCHPVAGVDELPPVGMLLTDLIVPLVEYPPPIASGWVPEHPADAVELVPVAPVAVTTTVLERVVPVGPCAPCEP